MALSLSGRCPCPQSKPGHRGIESEDMQVSRGRFLFVPEHQKPSSVLTGSRHDGKLQVYDMFAVWPVSAVANGPTGAGDEALTGVLEAVAGGAASVETANHGDPLEGKPWPVILTFPGSEESQKVKDAWLSEAICGHLATSKDLGVRPARVGRTNACLNTFQAKAGESLAKGDRLSLIESRVGTGRETSTCWAGVSLGVGSVSCGAGGG